MPRLDPNDIKFRDAGHGYDIFGLNPRTVAAATRIAGLLYDHYFRVTSHGAHHIPAGGSAILAANHSGTLPLDAAMLYIDVLTHTDPPRVPRALLDVFVPRFPFVGAFFARVGGVGGTRRNCRRLLQDGELIMVFPEGAPGIAKTFNHRYELQPWRVGHAELAIEYRVPVIPVAIIGAEEQWPLIARIDRFKVFGAPYLPIPATPLPLPAHYHIHYGEPIALHEDYSRPDPDDPEIVAAAAARVESAVQVLIERGLRERKGIFR
ncbi:MAG: acyltransferase family protein [Proteobacteria bacterium]|nr:acyltransferase family protein [Pseudomonadota bacterium]